MLHGICNILPFFFCLFFPRCLGEPWAGNGEGSRRSVSLDIHSSTLGLLDSSSTAWNKRYCNNWQRNY